MARNKMAFIEIEKPPHFSGCAECPYGNRNSEERCGFEDLEVLIEGATYSFDVKLKAEKILPEDMMVGEIRYCNRGEMVFPVRCTAPGAGQGSYVEVWSRLRRF